MMASSTSNSSSLAPGYCRLATHWRVLISLALLLHLTAVIVSPWSMQIEPGDPPPLLPATIVRPFGPYLDATYSGHGYRFFAPAPGPSHLVRYRLEMPDGKSKAGTFPDLQSQWPRLFYHRHFMLSEKLNGLFPPTDLPREDRARFLPPFQAAADSYANHLLHEYGAKQVTIELVRHELPSPQDLVDRRPLNTPSLYRTLWTKTYEGATP